MNLRDMARMLGARGGRSRAARLSAGERARIAAMGGHARRDSLEVARRIEDNLRYLEAARALRGPQPRIRRVRTCAGPLPGAGTRRT
ncbi:MAG: hypothetical protein IT183_04845 [Acidobacteria bacterium]|nr:hypothetical protein [Acidobacteriota bacterium]